MEVNLKKRGSVPAVFFDRDGVLNQAIIREGKPYPPASVGEFEIGVGVPEALTPLASCGFLLIGITNQPDIARGIQKREVVEAMNAILLTHLPLTEILVCYHDDRDDCSCRKPRPGLILNAAERYRISLADSYMVGDRWRDIEAGKRAGCTTIFVNYDYQERKADVMPDYVASSITEASAYIQKSSMIVNREKM